VPPQLDGVSGKVDPLPQTRREKNSQSFPGFSKAIDLLFYKLSQEKVNVIMTFIMIVMTLFIHQSTAV